MRNISVASLTRLKESMLEAENSGKPFKISSPGEFALIIDEFIKVRQERDILHSEQEKLLKVLSCLEEMAKKVQTVIEE